MFISLGEALIDLIPTTGDSLAGANTLSVQPGGAPLNVAIALNRLGVPVTFVGTLSGDGFGDRLRSILAREGVRHVPRRAVFAGTRLSVVDPGKVSDPFRFYGDQPADSQLGTDDIDPAFTSDVTGLYVSSLMMKDPGGAVAQRHAVDRALERRIPIVTDPNPRPSVWPELAEIQQVSEWLLSVASVAKLSLDDARALRWPDSPEELQRLARNQWNTRLVITDAERGCWFDTPNGIEFLPSFIVSSVDPTGAGDAFFAAMVSKCYEDDALMADMVRFAAAAGALTTIRHGAIEGLPFREEIEALAASRS